MDYLSDVVGVKNFEFENRDISITEKEGKIIFELIKNHHLHSTLEIGLAYGVSALYIMSATNSDHIAIDPFQAPLYKNLGLKNLEKINLRSRLSLISEKSCFALPELNRKKNKFDFIFIDGSHLFDDVFLDFYYADLLIHRKGFIILHDHHLPAIQKLESWIEKNKFCFQKTVYDNLSVFKKLSASFLKCREWDHFIAF